MHMVAHLAALTGLGVHLLLLLRVAHRCGPLKRTTCRRVHHALIHKSLEELLVKIRVVKNLSVMLNVLLSLHGCARARNSGPRNKALVVGAKGFPDGSGQRSRSRIVELLSNGNSGHGLGLGRPLLEHALAPRSILLLQLGHLCPDLVERSGLINLASFPLLQVRCAGRSNVNAEGVKRVPQLEGRCFGGLPGLLGFRGGGDGGFEAGGGKGVDRGQSFLELDAGAEERIKGLLLLADGESLVGIRLGSLCNVLGDGPVELEYQKKRLEHWIHTFFPVPSFSQVSCAV